jgi:hypothetical protein
MATIAGVISVVLGFAAALLLYEATVAKPRHEHPREGDRRARMRRLGIIAAVVAVAAAYVAALT